MAQQYESIKIILDRLLRNNVLNGLSFESVIDYTVDFMDIVGIPAVYEDKFHDTDIVNYRAKLPCDFIDDIQLLISTSPRGNNMATAREATDTFHADYSCNKLSRTSDFTYSIGNGYIFTSIETGKLKLAYKAIKTDEEGYPLLPANRTFLNALEWFIKYKYYTILWEEGRIEDKRYENTKQEYAWAVGQCETDMKRLSLAKAESFFNSFRTLIPRDNEFSKRFMNTGNKEYLRRH